MSAALLGFAAGILVGALVTGYCYHRALAQIEQDLTRVSAAARAAGIRIP